MSKSDQMREMVGNIQSMECGAYKCSGKITTHIFTQKKVGVLTSAWGWRCQKCDKFNEVYRN